MFTLSRFSSSRTLNRSFCRHSSNFFDSFQWREISKILEGVVRIGAVNCQDEWMMCNEQGIQAFPTLRIYPKVKIVRVEEKKTTFENLFQRDVFQGPRDKEILVRYAMSFVSANVVQFDDRMIENFHMDSKTPWLIVFCREIDENDCLDDDQIYKLAAIFVRFAFLFFVLFRLAKLSFLEQFSSCW